MMSKAIGVSLALGAGFVLGPLYLAMGLVGLGYIIGESRGRAHAEDVLRLGPGATRAMGLPPGPIETLNTFLRADREPPPIVVAYAMAESRLIGRDDLADDLERTFMGRKMISLPNSDVIITNRSAPQTPKQQTPAPGQQAAQPTAADQPSADSSQVPMGDADAMSSAGEFVGFQFETKEITSPLPSVSNHAWATYCHAFETETPTYESARRVGRYAARKDRLSELGCNPELLIKHPRAVELQDAAFAIDATDSARHLDESGMAREYVGKAVWLPDDPDPHKITLSGLIGVAQIAGLENCASWLEHRDDRKRFRHTTTMFTRTNGVF